MFNIVGYKFVANYFESKATQDLQNLLDQNSYSDADLISFKFESSLPYHSNSKEFETMNGNIDINHFISILFTILILIELFDKIIFSSVS